MIHADTPTWRRATLALCLGSMLVFINLYAPQPLLPMLREAHGASTLMIGLVMSLATLTLALSLLVYGPLSDAIGRGAIMKVSLAAVGLATLLIAFVPGLESLLAARVLQGLALGGLPGRRHCMDGGRIFPSGHDPCGRTVYRRQHPGRYRRAHPGRRHR